MRMIDQSHSTYEAKEPLPTFTLLLRVLCLLGFFSFVVPLSRSKVKENFYVTSKAM